MLNTVPAKVTPEMNDQLLAPFEEKEVKEALFQMFPTKAPGPIFFNNIGIFVGGGHRGSAENFEGR